MNLIPVDDVSIMNFSSIALHLTKIRVKIFRAIFTPHPVNRVLVSAVSLPKIGSFVIIFSQILIQ